MSEMYLTPEQKETRREIATATAALIEQILPVLKIHSWAISTPKVQEVAHYFLRDIDRLGAQQNANVAIIKFAAYWAFWIRKIKPIHSAMQLASTDNEKTFVEITDINERIALDIAIAYIRKTLPIVKVEKCEACDGISCFNQYTAKYFSARNGYHYKYIVYSLGKRTFGPHHISAFFDLMVFSSCPRNSS